MPDLHSMAVVPEQDQATISWQNVQVVASKKQKVLMEHITGIVKPAQMLAIMGPSGSGKTTLLDVLAGRSQSNLAVTGDIRVNGHATKMSYGTVAYVPQDDLLTGTLTVRETLNFAARLRMNLSAADRRSVVDMVLTELGLLSAENTPVGTLFIKGISGGQKRRLSIACEVLVSPSIMFLDEPTSGLDSASAFFCIQALKTLANQGRTIIASIHQPSAEVFELFDCLLLMSRGQMVYFGAAAAAGQFYADAGVPCPVNRAMADHFLFSMNTDFRKVAEDFVAPAPPGGTGGLADVEAPKGVVGQGLGHSLKLTADGSQSLPVAVTDAEQGISRLLSQFETTIRPELEQEVAQAVNTPGATYAGIRNSVNPVSQFFTLTHRITLNSLRDIGVFWLRLGMYVGLALCLGTIYFQLGKGWNEVTSRGGLVFFTVSFLTFMSISGFPSFVDEMKVFVRERLNGYYGVLPYTVANTIASLPFIALIAISCTVVEYYLADLNSDADRVGYFMLDLFVSLVTVEALMMMIAGIVPHYLLGLAGGAGLLGIFMPVAGYVIALGDIPKPVWRYPMHYLGYHTYSFHGMMLNEFQDTDGWECPCTLQPEGCEVEGCTINGDAVLKALDYTLDRTKWQDIGIQIIMTIVYRCGFFFMLKLREARSK